MYVNRLGELTAHQLSTATLLAALTLYIWLMDRRRPIPTTRNALVIGGIWAALTVLFEFGLGHYIVGSPWSELLANYNLAAGRMWVLVPHALVLWQVTSGGKAIDPAGPWGDNYVAWSWAFVLVPVDAAATRLLVRMRASYQPSAKWAPYRWLLVEPAHFVMGRRQLLGLRERAEATSREAPLSERA